jgi:putative colanic acid biosynthesis glycosyltransferase
MSISIITVHLNDFSGLQTTSRSLQALNAQTGVQWIVIDGASTPADEEQREVLDSTRLLSDEFVSEPDSGIYAAMNKGVHLAREQYLLFLNAGDRLHPGFDLERFLKTLEQTCPDMIWGSYDESGKYNRVSNIQPRNEKWLWWGMPTSHQAILFRRESLEHDPYDENLKIAGDYDLVLKLANTGATIETIPMPICISDGTGVSNVEQGPALAEQMIVRKRHFGTSTVVNLSISTAHRTISWVGRIGSLRKLWK